MTSVSTSGTGTSFTSLKYDYVIWSIGTCEEMVGGERAGETAADDDDVGVCWERV